MKILNKNKHISKQFNIELKEIVLQMKKMAKMTGLQFELAVEAVETHDPKLTKQVVKNDKKIKLLEVKIETDCILIIGKRQPNASDLRLIISIFKTIDEIEKIADTARKLALLTRFNLPDFYEEIIKLIIQQVQLSLQIFNQTIEAFINMDLDKLKSLYLKNKQLLELTNSIRNATIEVFTKEKEASHHGKSDTTLPINILYITRSIERIEARCRNICELAVFLIKGQNIRFQRKRVFFSLIDSSDDLINPTTDDIMNDN